MKNAVKNISKASVDDKLLTGRLLMNDILKYIDEECYDFNGEVRKFSFFWTYNSLNYLTHLYVDKLIKLNRGDILSNISKFKENFLDLVDYLFERQKFIQNIKGKDKRGFIPLFLLVKFFTSN